MHGLERTVGSQETLEMEAANYIQSAMAGKEGWKGGMDECLTAGRAELRDSRACLQQQNYTITNQNKTNKKALTTICVSLDCSSSGFLQ